MKTAAAYLCLNIHPSRSQRRQSISPKTQTECASSQRMPVVALKNYFLIDLHGPALTKISTLA